MLFAIGLVVAFAQPPQAPHRTSAEVENAKKGLACFRALGLIESWAERNGDEPLDLFHRTCEDLAYRLSEFKKVKKRLGSASYDSPRAAPAKPSPLEEAAASYLISEVERLSRSGNKGLEMLAARNVRDLPTIIKTLARAPADIPKFHWIYEGIAKCRADGIPVGYLYEGRLNNAAVPRFRFDFARSTILINCATGRMFRLGLEGAYEQALVPATYPYIQFATDRAKAIHDVMERKDYVDDFKFCDKLTDYFADDLRALGYSPQRLHQEIQISEREIASIRVADIGSALKQFSDVPYNHWAAQATLELREEGILRGDPDYRFHGK